MTREETIQLLMVIQAAYPNYKPQDKSIAVNTWHMMLDEYEYNQVITAVKSFIATDTSGFAPSIGQVIEKIHSADTLNDVTDMAAWALVRSSLSYYDSAKNFAELPETIQKAVGSSYNLKEWSQLPISEVDTVIQSNFLKAYRAQVKREHEMKRLPSDVRNLLLQASNSSQIEKKDS